ncbi:MAG: helix-turn-helix domain-containing protein [Syntrophomonadaceae bacterium]|nr:helix-turn-helix domain-containing protein [Syntrophomonadaceae bacterium]
MSRTMLEAKEAADYLKVSYWTLLDKAKKGAIPHVKVGRRVLFSLEGLSEWIKEQELSSVSKESESQKSQYGVLRKIKG